MGQYPCQAQFSKMLLCMCVYTNYIYRTYGSGVYIGLDPCLMYWVLWNTRNAKPAKKSLEDSRPATGRSLKPVQSVTYQRSNGLVRDHIICTRYEGLFKLLVIGVPVVRFGLGLFFYVPPQESCKTPFKGPLRDPQSHPPIFLQKSRDFYTCRSL